MWLEPPSGGLELGYCVGGGWGGILLRGGFSQSGVRKMALVKSSLLSTISGSIGGTTYARNRGGAYARNRSLPIQPRSPQQERARSQLAFFSVYWSDTLTQNEREAWNQYASSLSALNRIGDSIIRTGQQAFVQSNTLAQLAGLAVITTAPASNVQFAIAANPQVVSHDVSSNTATFNLTQAITATVLGFCSPPVSNGSAATAQDFRFFGTFAASAATTIAVSGTNTGRRVFVAGMNQIWRFRAIAADGSFSNQLILRGLSQA